MRNSVICKSTKSNLFEIKEMNKDKGKYIVASKKVTSDYYKVSVTGTPKKYSKEARKEYSENLKKNFKIATSKIMNITPCNGDIKGNINIDDNNIDDKDKHHNNMINSNSISESISINPFNLVSTRSNTSNKKNYNKGMLNLNLINGINIVTPKILDMDKDKRSSNTFNSFFVRKDEIKEIKEKSNKESKKETPKIDKKYNTFLASPVKKYGNNLEKINKDKEIINTVKKARLTKNKSLLNSKENSININISDIKNNESNKDYINNKDNIIEENNELKFNFGGHKSPESGYKNKKRSNSMEIITLLPSNNDIGLKRFTNTRNKYNESKINYFNKVEKKNYYVNSNC